MKRGGKITVVCPHCGHEQQEPDLVRSTYCRKCSGYFTVAHGHKPIAPPGSGKVPLKPHRPEEPAKESGPAGGGGGGGMLHWLGGIVGTKRTRNIRCFECNHAQEVSTSARSSICPACSAYIDLEDVRINATFSRALRTRGDVIIAPKGEYASTRGFCGNVLVQGKLKGTLVCSGEAVVKAKGRMAGSLEADHLIIDKHSEVEFSRVVKARTVEIRGKLSARLEASGVVHVAKGGSLEGSVVAKGLSVDKGGFFSGDVTVGRIATPEQGELSLEQPREPKGDNTREMQGGEWFEATT